jgi:hypothetical protein
MEWIVAQDGSGDFTSIVAARNHLRTVLSGQSANWTVKLRAGYYRISGGTLAFDERDRGRNGYTVTWSRYGNEVPIVTGCIAPSSGSWTHVGGGVYACDLSGYSPPSGGINAMWEQGTACYIAGNEPALRKTSWRIPTAIGPLSDCYDQTWMDFPSGTIASGVTADGNLRLQCIPRYKEQTRVVTGLSGNRVSWSGKFYSSGDCPFSANKVMARLYNHRNLLTRAGQFYYNRSTRIMYYMPRTTPIQVEIPILAPGTPVVTIEGGTTRVSNFVLDRWTIQGTNKFLDGPPTIGPYTAYGALHVDAANDLVIQNCRVRQTGIDGITTGTGAPRLTISGCWIYDIGRHGVHVRGGIGSNAPSARTNNTTYGTLWNTKIENCGDAKYWANGIGVRFHETGGWTLRYNDVEDCSDALLNCEGTTNTWNNTEFEILNNRWSGPACRNKNDTGMFYNSASFGGNIIGNVFEDWDMDGESQHHTFFGGVIYCDNMPELVTIEDNIFMNIGLNSHAQVRGLTWMKGQRHTIRNNIFYNIKFYTGINYSLCHNYTHTRNTCDRYLSEKNVYLNCTCYDPTKNDNLYWVLSHAADHRLSRGCDLELIWEVSTPRFRDTRYGSATMLAWRNAYGFLLNARIENPRFTNAAAGDFSHLSGSPCTAMGIKALNRSMAGLRSTFPSWEDDPSGPVTPPPSTDKTVAVSTQTLSCQMLSWPADADAVMPALSLYVTQRAAGTGVAKPVTVAGGLSTSVLSLQGFAIAKSVDAQSLSLSVPVVQTTAGQIVYLDDTLEITGEVLPPSGLQIDSTIVLLYPLRLLIRQRHAIGYDPEGQTVFDGKMRKVIFGIRRM